MIISYQILSTKLHCSCPEQNNNTLLNQLVRILSLKYFQIMRNPDHYMTGVYPHSGRSKVQGRMCKLEPGLPHNNQP